MKKLGAIMTLLFLSAVVISTSMLFAGGIATATGHPEYLAPLTALSALASFVMIAFNYTGEGIAFDVPAAKPFTKGICLAIQSSLNEILGSNDPALKRTQVGYLQALMSPQNTAGVTIVPVDQKNGKKRKVRIVYIQRGTASDIAHSEASNCDPEVFPEPAEDEAEVTKFIRTKWYGFNEEDMRLLCEGDASYRGRVMSSKIDTLMVELNKKLIQLQAANFGAFNPINYGTYKDVPMLMASGNAINYLGETIITTDFQNLDSQAKPIVIGGGNLNTYAKMAKIGCCNDLGIDLGQAGNMDFFYDRFVNNILGANHFIGLVPGYVQLLTWNKYVGAYKKDSSEIFAAGTIVDPYTGVTLDMKWVYDYDCAEQYKCRFFLHYDLWFIPTDSFADGDELEGVNFTLHYRAVAAAS